MHLLIQCLDKWSLLKKQSMRSISCRKVSFRTIMLEIRSENKLGSCLIKETCEYVNLLNLLTGKDWLQPDVLGTIITAGWHLQQKYGVFSQSARSTIWTARKYGISLVTWLGGPRWIDELHRAYWTRQANMPNSDPRMSSGLIQICSVDMIEYM